jgi:hypothetical protein
MRGDKHPRPSGLKDGAFWRTSDEEMGTRHGITQVKMLTLKVGNCVSSYDIVKPPCLIDDVLIVEAKGE